jgi:hypothetical protein
LFPLLLHQINTLTIPKPVPTQPATSQAAAAPAATAKTTPTNLSSVQPPSFVAPTSTVAAASTANPNMPNAIAAAAAASQTAASSTATVQSTTIPTQYFHAHRFLLSKPSPAVNSGNEDEDVVFEPGDPDGPFAHITDPEAHWKAAEETVAAQNAASEVGLSIATPDP